LEGTVVTLSHSNLVPLKIPGKKKKKRKKNKNKGPSGAARGSLPRPRRRTPSPVFPPRPKKQLSTLVMDEKQRQGQRFVLHHPSGDRVGTTGYKNKNRGEGQKPDKKNPLIYSKIFFLKKLISTIFLQEQKSLKPMNKSLPYSLNFSYIFIYIFIYIYLS